MTYEDFCKEMKNRDLIDNTAAFIMEDTSAEQEEATRMARFIHFVANAGVAKNLNNWVVGDKARVYFEFESQNSLAPIRFANKFYFCAARMDVFIQLDIVQEKVETRLSDVNFSLPAGFSGAKTREKIRSFAESFYVEFSNE